MNWTTADLHEHYRQQGATEPLKAACGDGGIPVPEPGGVPIAFTVPGPPRTKKTSNRIVQIKGKGGGRGFTKILPSEAHDAWFKAAMTYAPSIRARLARAGISLPLDGFLQVTATFYRDRNTGDLLGYEQAIADWLQEPKTNDNGKIVRKGAAIIHDDVQIQSWDGSRLAKDASCPRIEVQIWVMAPAPPASGDLFTEDEEF